MDHVVNRLSPGTVLGMRWDRLFADLEAAADDDDLLEREALVAELRDEEWARTPWRDLLVGEVELDVAGAGQVAGRVRLVNERLVRVSTPQREHVVALAAVRGVTASGDRAPEPSVVAARLGWSQVLRRLRDDGEPCRVVTTSGAVHDAHVEQVLADAVLLRVGRRSTALPLAVVAVVTIES